MEQNEQTEKTEQKGVQVSSWPVENIIIPPGRIRKKISAETVELLMLDILENTLYNPIAVRNPTEKEISGGLYTVEDKVLLAGEHRLKAVKRLFETDCILVHNGMVFTSECPYTLIEQVTDRKALEIELHENLLRSDLDWRDIVSARDKLHIMRLEEAVKKGETWDVKDTAKELSKVTKISLGWAEQALRQASLIAPYLDDPILDNVKTVKKAEKIVLKFIEGEFLRLIDKDFEEDNEIIDIVEISQSKVFDISDFLKQEGITEEEVEAFPEKDNEADTSNTENIGTTVSNKKPSTRKEETEASLKTNNLVRSLENTCEAYIKSKYILHKGYFQDIDNQGLIPHNHFDLILADPPYGISAEKHGTAAKTIHTYVDSPQEAAEVASEIFRRGYLWAKENALLYMFCDVDLFTVLKTFAELYSWRVFRTPLIWTRSGQGHIPWGVDFYRRQYDLILCAQKGNLGLQKLTSDVIQVNKEAINNSGMAARKPPLIYTELISNSFKSDEPINVIDPTCGTGSIFTGARLVHNAQVFGIEQDEEVYKLALTEMNEAMDKELSQPNMVGSTQQLMKWELFYANQDKENTDGT